MSAHLLLDLQLIDFRRKVGQNLVSLLMEFELCSDELGEVTQRFGSIEDLHHIRQSLHRSQTGISTHILHDADRLFYLRDKLILFGLDFGPSFLSQVCSSSPSFAPG